MIDVGIGISLEKNAVLAAEEAVRRAKKSRENPGKTGLAVVFASADIPAPTLLKALHNQLMDVPLIGLSGPAIFSHEGIFTHGVQVALFDAPSDIYYTVSSVNDLKNISAHQSGSALGENLLYGFKNMPRSFGLLLFDRVIEDGRSFITGIQEHLGTSFPCLGACASDPFTPTKNRIFFGQSAITDGCCGALWGGKLNFGFGVQHGWKPLGKPRVITASAGNVIKTIDTQPAAKLYEDYLATTLPELKKGIIPLSSSYPIGIKIEGENEYLIRNVVFIDDDGSLHCQGNIPPGATIRLMISTKETCLNATRAALEEALASLVSPVKKFIKEKTSKFAIAFSSFSRYTLLRRDAVKEYEMMRQMLGDVPFIGIYTASELAPLQASSYHGQAYFHNQTFSCLIMEG